MKILTLNIFVEIICFLVAFFTLKSDKKLFWKTPIIYLLIVCITELSARYTGAVLHRPNGWIHNILLLFEIAFLHYAFNYFLNRYSTVSRSFVLCSFIILLTLYAIEFFYWKTNGFYTTTFNILSVLTVIFCLYYFYLFINQPDYIVIKFHTDFWFISGILFFYFGGTIMNLIYPKFSISLAINKSLRYVIYNVLIITLYSFWSYSFICRHRTTKLQQSSP